MHSACWSLSVAALGLLLIFAPWPTGANQVLTDFRVGLGALLTVGGLGKALYDTFFFRH